MMDDNGVRRSQQRLESARNLGELHSRYFKYLNSKIKRDENALLSCTCICIYDTVYLLKVLVAVDVLPLLWILKPVCLQNE